MYLNFFASQTLKGSHPIPNLSPTKPSSKCRMCEEEGSLHLYHLNSSRCTKVNSFLYAQQCCVTYGTYSGQLCDITLIKFPERAVGVAQALYEARKCGCSSQNLGIAGLVRLNPPKQRSLFRCGNSRKGMEPPHGREDVNSFD